MNLVFNSEYILKIEEGAVLIMPKENMISSETMSDSNFFMRLHSIHASILCFFDGRKTEEAFSAAADFLKVSVDYIADFVNKLTNNEERLGINFKGEIIQFPKKLFVLSDEKRKETYDPSTFDFQNLNFGLQRHITPTDITLMVNTRCATDCIYCYADRRRLIDCQVPLERIKELILEAKQLQMRSFDVIGGEFMLYKHWKELLSFLLQHGFDPFISTKVPIGEEAVKSLKELGGKGLQVSLDSLNPATAVALLKVKPDYIEKMKQSLRLIDSYDIPLFIHSIVTRLNDTAENAAIMYDFIKELKNVKVWRLDLPSISLYKNKDVFTSDLRPDRENLSGLVAYLNDIRENDKPHFELKNSLDLPGTEKMEVAEKRLQLLKNSRKDPSALQTSRACSYCRMARLPCVKNCIGMNGLLLVT